MFSAEVSYAAQHQAQQQQQQQQQKLQHRPIWVFRPTPPFSKDYTLLETIGGGAYGKVYRCFDNTDPSKIYAVKIVSKNHFRHDLDLFRHEITIMQVLHHPNLIEFINVYENETYLYIVMEFLPEGDLFSLLTRHFPTAINQVENPLPVLPPPMSNTPPPIMNCQDASSQLLPTQHQNKQGSLYNPDLEPSRLVVNKKNTKEKKKSKQKSSCCCCCCGGGGDDSDDASNNPMNNSSNNHHSHTQHGTKMISNDAIQKLTDRARKTYSERDVANWVYQIAMGLEYLHAKNIVHADIKPENILVRVIDSNSNPSDSTTSNDSSQIRPSDKKQAKLIRKSRKRYHCKIIDYGLSSLVERRHIVVSQDGSPEYMSPEVIKGQYTIHSDMWSLGILVFNLLFGFTPFMAYNVVDTLKLIEREGFKPDNPTLGHCNSFPEYFINKTEAQMAQKAQDERDKCKKAKQALKQTDNKDGRSDRSGSNNLSESDKKCSQGSLQEPLLVRVSFDNEDSSNVSPQCTTAHQNDNNGDSDDDDVAFKSSVKPGTYKKSVQQIVREQYSTLLPRVSSYAKDLICRLLVSDPLQRLSATEVLQHPWFVKCSKYKNQNIFQLRDQDKELSFFGKLFGSKSGNTSGFFNNIPNPFASSQSSNPSTPYQSLNKQQPTDLLGYSTPLDQSHASVESSQFFSSGGVPGLNPLQQYSTRTKLKRTLLRSLVEQLSEEDIRDWKKRLLFFNEQRLFRANSSHQTLNTQQSSVNFDGAQLHQIADQPTSFASLPPTPTSPSDIDHSQNSDLATAVNLNGSDENGLNFDNHSDAMSNASYMTNSSMLTGTALSIAPSTTSLAITTPYWKVGSLDVIKLFNQDQGQMKPKNSLITSTSTSTSIFAGPPTTQTTLSSRNVQHQLVSNSTPTTPNSPHIPATNSPSSRIGQQGSHTAQVSPIISPAASTHSSTAPATTATSSQGSQGDKTPPVIGLNKLTSRNRTGLQAFAAPRLQPAQSTHAISKTPSLQPQYSECTLNSNSNANGRNGNIPALDPNLTSRSNQATGTAGSATDFIPANAISPYSPQDVSPILPIDALLQGNQTPSPIASLNSPPPALQHMNSDSALLLPPAGNHHHHHHHHHHNIGNTGPDDMLLRKSRGSSTDDKITRLMAEYNLSNEELIDLIMASLEQKLLQKEDRLYALFDAIQSTGLTEKQLRDKNTTPLHCLGPQTGIGTINTTQLAQYLHISPFEANSMLKEGLLYLKTIHDDEMLPQQAQDSNNPSNDTACSPTKFPSGLINSPSSLGNDQLEKSSSFLQTHNLNSDMINFNDDLDLFEDKINNMDELELNADQFIALFALQTPSALPTQEGSEDMHPFGLDESHPPVDLNQSPHQGTISLSSKRSGSNVHDISVNPSTPVVNASNTPLSSAAVLVDLDPTNTAFLTSSHRSEERWDESSERIHPTPSPKFDPPNQSNNIVNIGPFGDKRTGNIYDYDDFNSEIDENEAKARNSPALQPQHNLNGQLLPSKLNPSHSEAIFSPNHVGIDVHEHSINNNSNQYDSLINVDQFSEYNDQDNYVDDVYEMYSNVMTSQEYLALPVNPFQTKSSVTGSTQGSINVHHSNNTNNNNTNNKSLNHLQADYHHTPPIQSINHGPSNPSNQYLPPALQYNSPQQPFQQHVQQQPVAHNSGFSGRKPAALSSQPLLNQPQQSQLYKQSSRFGQQQIVHNVHHKPMQQTNARHQRPIDQDLDLDVPVVTDMTSQHQQYKPQDRSIPITINQPFQPFQPFQTPPPAISSSYKDASVFTNKAFAQPRQQQTILGSRGHDGNLFGTGLTTHRNGPQQGSSFTPTFSVGSFTNSYLPKNNNTNIGMNKASDNNNNNNNNNQSATTQTPQFEPFSGSRHTHNSNHVANMSPLQGAMNGPFGTQKPGSFNSLNNSPPFQPSLLSIAQKRLEFQQQENIFAHPSLSQNDRNTDHSNAAQNP